MRGEIATVFYEFFPKKDFPESTFTLFRLYLSQFDVFVEKTVIVKIVFPEKAALCA